MGPARMIVESLTPRPGIREQYRHVASISAAHEVRSHSEALRTCGELAAGLGAALMTQRPHRQPMIAGEMTAEPHSVDRNSLM